MGYEYIEHTADIGFTASNTSVEGLFIDCFTALMNVMFEGSNAAGCSVDIVAEADDSKALLKEFLHKMIMLLDSDNFVPQRVETIIINETQLRCTLSGDTYDKRRHRLKTLVKAVTYHKLSLEKAGGRWQATVILNL